LLQPLADKRNWFNNSDCKIENAMVYHFLWYIKRSNRICCFVFV